MSVIGVYITYKQLERGEVIYREIITELRYPNLSADCNTVS